LSSPTKGDLKKVAGEAQPMIIHTTVLSTNKFKRHVYKRINMCIRGHNGNFERAKTLKYWTTLICCHIKFGKLWMNNMQAINWISDCTCHIKIESFYWNQVNQPSKNNLEINSHLHCKFISYISWRPIYFFG
jgi:hypothetical protein